VTLAFEALSSGRLGEAKRERHRGATNVSLRNIGGYAMLKRKKSIGPRTRLARRSRPKLVSPSIGWFPEPLDAFSHAQRLRQEYVEMVDGHHAELRQFLQRACHVAVQFRRRPKDFERLKADPFWEEASRQRPKDASTSKWPLYYASTRGLQRRTPPASACAAPRHAIAAVENRPRKIAPVLDDIMQATTRNVRSRAGKYAVILDGLMQDKVQISAVASRIKELGGATLAGEPVHLRLDVTMFPANRDGWVQIVGDNVTQVAEKSSGAPRKRRVPAPRTNSALRLRARLRARGTRD
jgi:hypothetical protein